MEGKLTIEENKQFYKLLEDVEEAGKLLEYYKRNYDSFKSKLALFINSRTEGYKG